MTAALHNMHQVLSDKLYDIAKCMSEDYDLALFCKHKTEPRMHILLSNLSYDEIKKGLDELKENEVVFAGGDVLK